LDQERRPATTPLGQKAGVSGRLQGEKRSGALLLATRKRLRQLLGNLSPRPRPRKDYESTWAGRLGEIEAVLGEGERSLPRVLNRIARGSERKRGIGMEAFEVVAFDRIIEVPGAGAMKAFRTLVVDAILDSCSPETESVIDLGSGWGEHLLTVWLEGGPRNATYYACEIAASGRRCTEVLAELEKQIRIQALSFDFENPSFERIPRGQREIVVTTVHSVEQVAEIPGTLFDRLFELAESVRGVHLEPVGWQLVAPERWSKIMQRHAARCQRMNYNRNLWTLLSGLESEGRISIEAAVPNIYGMEYNPASLITWQKRA
jgi:hypothetical protein